VKDVNHTSLDYVCRYIHRHRNVIIINIQLRVSSLKQQKHWVLVVNTSWYNAALAF